MAAVIAQELLPTVEHINRLLNTMLAHPSPRDAAVAIADIALHAHVALETLATNELLEKIGQEY